MVHLHYYITAGDTIDETTRIFVVSVGTTAQANRDYLFLTAHAVTHGHYFELKSKESAEFVSRLLRENHVPESSMTPVKARDLVRAIKSDTAVPLSSFGNADYLKKQLDVNYRLFSNLTRRATSLA